MPTKSQIEYLEKHKKMIIPPILIIGSKNYDYDFLSFKSYFINHYKLNEIIGIDLEVGCDVDFVVNIDSPLESINFLGKFNTIIIMEVLRYVKNPFNVADNIYNLLNLHGIVIVSECLTIKESQMPVDRFRFTKNGILSIFEKLYFEESDMSYSLARISNLENNKFNYYFEVYKKLEEENIFDYIIKRLFFKIYRKGYYNRQSRFLAEIRNYYIGRKNE